MRHDDFNERLRMRSRTLRRTRGLHTSHKPDMHQCLTLQELLASDMTLAVMRADALEMRCFETTLREAAKRLRFGHGEFRPPQDASLLGLESRQD